MKSLNAELGRDAMLDSKSFFPFRKTRMAVQTKYYSNDQRN